MSVTDHMAEDATKAMMLKDLRVECRARGISPAGGREQLLQRVRENMVETGDCTIKSAAAADVPAEAAAPAAPGAIGVRNNNYARPDGQNNHNFITDKPSSRVLAAPGGGSSICFGDDSSSASAAGKVPPPPAAAGKAAPSPMAAKAAPAAATASNVESTGPHGYAANNYARPGGQNVGNFLDPAGRTTSRVLAPPGGISSIRFG